MPDMPLLDFYLSGVSGGEGTAVVECEKTCPLPPAALSSSWRMQIISEQSLQVHPFHPEQTVEKESFGCDFSQLIG